MSKKVTLDLSKVEKMHAFSVGFSRMPDGTTFWVAYVHIGSGEQVKVYSAMHPTPQGAINAAAKKAENYARAMSVILNQLVV